MNDMSYYEISDLMFSLVGYGMTALALYFTVVSGYLVVAYLAGPQLSRFQVTFINCLFVAFASIVSFGTYSFFRGAYRLGEASGPIEFWLAPALGVSEVLGILGSLFFMFQNRRSDTGA